MQTIDVTAQSPATAPALYALLTDGASWPTWAPVKSFELERPGESERECVGAIRVFRAGWVTGREEVVELVPGRRLSYVLLSGLPLRGYRADVDLTPNGAGTEIRWHSTFRPKIPGTGWLFRVALTRFLRRFANSLAAATQATSRSD